MQSFSKIHKLIGTGQTIVPQPNASPSDTVSIGARLKAIRTKAGVSISALARDSNVSKSNISKIENGIISPTFEMMEKISKGLEISTSYLLSRDSLGNVGISLSRAQSGFKMTDQHYEFEFLFSDLQTRRMVPFVTTVTSNGLPAKEPAAHKGEEFFYVLSGSVDFVGGDNDPIAMETGDSVYFDSNEKHLVVNRTYEESKLLWVWLE
ncbi:helix-turn-helix domain-containing protein [Roseovarius pelagicus]|uniref:XRE family transcriptional regulator n=1 Tax=Roseovarius pelagicus TaxID=2980108 RepID=A0ABY6DCM4_9RHOB|nr:XRE family transcriptional regulator [Roseovarius pelagicus]UXX83619.1 XRE family transcriptional regulator [Roseovarius pelagicus]